MSVGVCLLLRSAQSRASSGMDGRDVGAFENAIMDSSDQEDMETAIILCLLIRRRRRRRRRRRWVRPIFTQRRDQGEYRNLLQEMRLSDPECLFRYIRMSKERFDSLLVEVS